MDGWSMFRKFSSRVNKRRSKAPASTDHSQTPAVPVVANKPAMAPITVPETQSVLLLYGPRQPYKLVDSHPVPQLKNEDEILVKTCAIGLNPIDWKAPDYNFAIPELPYLSGRESSGDVCQVFSPSSRLNNGDRVRHLSTARGYVLLARWNAHARIGHCYFHRLPRLSESSVPRVCSHF